MAPEIKAVMDEYRPRFTALGQAVAGTDDPRGKESLRVWKKMLQAPTPADARQIAEDFLNKSAQDDIPF